MEAKLKELKQANQPVQQPVPQPVYNSSVPKTTTKHVKKKHNYLVSKW